MTSVAEQPSAPVKGATELYHVKLNKPAFTLGDINIPLAQGLLSTIENIKKNTDAKTLRLLGPLLGAVTRDTDKILNLLVGYAQLEWYSAKGSTTPPQSVVGTYNKYFQEAQVSDQEATPGNTGTAAEPAVKKERSGTRPYCRSLIEAGETNEEVLLAAVHAKFPDKATVFKVADVRGQLRVAGKLDWTKRKGSKDAPAAVTTEPAAS